MMPKLIDTIVAVATPPGRGAVGIVRVSGTQVAQIVQALCRRTLEPRHATMCRFVDAESHVIDTGIALYFEAPNSFTGEAVLELQAHGGRIVLDLLVRRVCQLGARVARPGEFSLRAFLNDKIDLSQAEAIADLIDARTEAAARSAQQSLAGEFSKEIRCLSDAIIETRVWVEAAIDFPDEEIDFLETEDLLARVKDLEPLVQSVLARAKQGALLKDGITLAIVGRPNVGKSSLLNCLTGEETAIVTEIPGTTRDLLRSEIQVDGIPINLVDTAGVRPSDDVVERAGIERTFRTLEAADVVLLVVDDREGVVAEDEQLLRRIPASAQVLTVRNKVDLSGRTVGRTSSTVRDEVRISALHDRGVSTLRDQIKRLVGYDAHDENVFSARRRHLDALKACLESIRAATTGLEEQHGGELVAEDLRRAHNALGEIVGEFTNDDLLGEIFSGFCIGK